MTFQTARGTTKTDEVVDYYVSDLDMYVTAWVLDDSPPLLSLGKLVEDFDLVYTWDRWNGAVIKINDRVIKCSINQRCPFVATSLGNPGVSSPPISKAKDPLPAPKSMVRRKKKIPEPPPEFHREVIEEVEDFDDLPASSPPSEAAKGDDVPPPPELFLSGKYTKMEVRLQILQTDPKRR